MEKLCIGAIMLIILLVSCTNVTVNGKRATKDDVPDLRHFAESAEDPQARASLYLEIFKLSKEETDLQLFREAAKAMEDRYECAFIFLDAFEVSREKGDLYLSREAANNVRSNFYRFRTFRFIFATTHERQDINSAHEAISCMYKLNPVRYYLWFYLKINEWVFCRN